MQKMLAIPSFLIILMGTIDCLTTMVGVVFARGSELNPFMAGIVSTNLGAFLVIKIAATLLIAATYVLANKTISKTQDKTTKTFKYSNKFLKIAFGGIIAFLIITVVNNLIVLIA